MFSRFWSSLWSLSTNFINIHNPPQSYKFSQYFTTQIFQTNPQRWQWLNSGNLHPIMFHPRNEKKHSITFYKTVFLLHTIQLIAVDFFLFSHSPPQHNIEFHCARSVFVRFTFVVLKAKLIESNFFLLCVRVL